MKKAIIIGSNGYIGKHLALYLRAAGWELRLYDLQPAQANSINYRTLDILDKKAVHEIPLEVDFIFYMAGITGTGNAYEKYEHYIDVNEKGLLHLLDAMRKSKSKARIVFPSTRLVYKGVENMPLAEHATKEFKTIYALNKWTCEQLLSQYAAYFGVHYTIVRICVPYATLFNEGYSYGTVGFFLSRASRGEPINLYGDGSQKRTLTHVEDICYQVASLLDKEESVNNIFNIAGETFSLYELASLIGARFNAKLVFLPWPELDLKLESGDTIFDGRKIQELIGVTNNHTLSAWIKQL
jgi:UDP-glucose 4-epimerase